MHVRIAGPDGYPPDRDVDEGPEDCGHHGWFGHRAAGPRAAADGADVIVTDTWVSMGKEDEEAARERLRALSVDGGLMAHAEPDAIVLHCLPAYRGNEITAEVIDGPQSVVWDEAENRRHAQKAMLALISTGPGRDLTEPTSPRSGPPRRPGSSRSSTSRHHEVKSQGELADLLADQGVHVTQATLSRDLVELDAVKVRAVSGVLVYAVPGEGGDRTPAVAREAAAATPGLRGCAASCWSARTPAPTWWCCAPRPGPRTSWPPPSTRPTARLLGTIAGDDTVLVIARDPHGGDKLVRRFLALADHHRARRPRRKRS